MFTLTVVTADSYQASPLPDFDPVFSSFRGSEIKHVPVIRIFGSTPTGQKTCLHIHGVFPYLYIPCVVEKDFNRYVYSLAASIDGAINASLGSFALSKQHVYKIQKVSGIPFYGYHEKEHVFFKIYFYNPGMLKKATDLLQSGAVLNEFLQPHEAHIPFVLQFMIDYNIYGMNTINLSHVTYRQLQKTDSCAENINEPQSFDNCSVSSVARQSVCDIEIDTTASNILNREINAENIEMNPGIAAIWKDERLRRAKAGLEDIRTQILYSNELRTNVTTVKTYQEERLAQRFQEISKQNDSLVSGNSSLSKYPIESEEGDSAMQASFVTDHLKEQQDIIKYSTRIESSNETVSLEPLTVLNNSINHSMLSGSTILSEDDMNLLELLTNLAEENINGIDNDSVLGSQKSMLNVQENLETGNNDDDLEDLNMTTSQLEDDVSCESENFKQIGQLKLINSNLLQSAKCSYDNQILELNVVNLTQNVDNNDEVSKPSELLIEKNQVININDDGSAVHEKDIEQLESREVSSEIKMVEQTSNSDITDNELQTEADITILTDEKRVCSLKYKKHDSDDTLLRTPKKKRKNVEDSNIVTPSKKHCRDIQILKLENSPHRKSQLKSPQRCRNYTPLRITISSPKGKKEISQSNETQIAVEANSVINSAVINLKQKSSHLNLADLTESTDNISYCFDVISDKSPNIPASSDDIKSEDLKKRDISVISSLSFNEHIPSSPNLNEIPLYPGFISNKVIEENNEKNNIVNDASSSVVYKLSNITSSLENIDKVNNCIENAAEDICNVTFTDCINLKSQEKSTKSGYNQAKLSSLRTKVIIIRPKFNPPSIEIIKKTKDQFNFIQTNYVLNTKLNKMQEKKTMFKKDCNSKIAAFKSNLSSVTGLTFWRRIKVNEFHPSGSNLKTCDMKRALAGFELLTIKPFLSPPKPENIRLRKHVNNKKFNNKPLENMNAATDININKIKIESINNQVHIQANSTDLKTKKSDKLFNTLNAREEISPGPNESQISGKLCENSDVISEDSSYCMINKTSKDTGVSYGQLDFTTNVSSNPSDKNFQDARATVVYRYLTIMCLEIHVNTREDLFPDPKKDSLQSIFYIIKTDIPEASSVKQIEHGAIIVNVEPVSNTMKKNFATVTNCSVSYVTNEYELLDCLITLINKYDPDILTGWQIETLSWGYIFQRASIVGLNNFPFRISRICSTKSIPDSHTEKSDTDFSLDFKVPGRIVLDTWRIMRHEIALLSYTFENIMYHIMRERHSYHSFKTLTEWWKNCSKTYRYRVIEYYLTRVMGTLKILYHLDIIGRTSEYAKLFGIQFYEVFSRGSQFRVESMMLRLAKSFNYIPVSPSINQRANMRAPEFLPLILEPKSIYYTDPLIVLDFQSLYPSLIIAYNYCFSTCLGKIENIGETDPYVFGATTLRVGKKTVLRLKGKVNVSPCGVAFVDETVRKGILPRMLAEILNTRLMVKESMKLYSSDNRALQRVLDSQQLGLKLIANVTYGYTAANFSGRMPCMELADSVVSKGRETLERAMKTVESTPQWGAQVVYGDTDSLFVLVPGKTREEAFKIGHEIADAVTASNPPPVKLKFEKILHPSILQTKKRYCGYMYESIDQNKPTYLAKGIETVRRDGCPAVSKILEKLLKILFETNDINAIKQYVVRQFDKILNALELTRRLIKRDPCAVPRTGERVPYIIIAGAPNQALIQCVRTPWELLNDPGLSPNIVYYITKVIIPPLNRCLNLMGVDANTWYREMSHRQIIGKTINKLGENKRLKICQFFNSATCSVCEKHSTSDICSNCEAYPNQTLVILHEKQRYLERSYYNINAICHSCVGRQDDPECSSLDCPVLYRIIQAKRDLTEVVNIRFNINELMKN
ncbi:DNA polymerase zeta catalytic subunit isoform X2 [Prorops nasuta]|uniref:DNA polymerase zeta catalytic subunit isoform X2 n=1 Tax=Prorops nasuta TaxID=863751 RepID=UPI0034CFDA6F